MKTKILLPLVVLVCCMLMTLSLPSVSATPMTSPIKHVFNLGFLVRTSWDSNGTSPPINRGEIRNVRLNISYCVERGAWGRVLLALLTGRQYVIHGEAIDTTPEWSAAALSSETLPAVISSDIRMIPVTLTIGVNTDAPPYALGTVQLHFWVDDYKGPLGLRTLINGYDSNFTFTFVTGP